MKALRFIGRSLIFSTLAAAAFLLSSCATEQRHNTESLLSAAGFHTLTPSTPQQQASYAALPPYKLERSEINGKVVYAYAARRSGIMYVGGERQFQRYKELALQQQVARDQLEAAEMNENAVVNWSYWGPAGMWW